MAEAPEEVLVDIEATDNATPNITSVGRSIAVLGSTLGILTRDFGIHNAALTGVIRGIQELGAAVRAVGAVQRLLAIATQFLVITETQEGTEAAFVTAMRGGQVAAAGTLTAANYGLAASFEAVNAAMGPVGWALLGLGLLGAGAIGFSLAGGFGGGGAAAPAGPMPGTEGMNIQVNMPNVNMSTKRDITETVNDMGTLIYQHMRRFRR